MSSVPSVSMGAHLPQDICKGKKKTSGVRLSYCVGEILLITTAHTMLADLRTSTGSPESASSLNEGD